MLISYLHCLLTPITIYFGHHHASTILPKSFSRPITGSAVSISFAILNKFSFQIQVFIALACLISLWICIFTKQHYTLASRTHGIDFKDRFLLRLQCIIFD